MAEQTEGRPANLQKRIVMLAGISLFVLLLDQGTKFWAVENLKDRPGISYLGGMIRLLYAENTGAWGSLGSDWPEPLKLVVMIILPLLVLGWIAIRVLRDHNIRPLEGIAYSFFISGGAGNLIDRLRDQYVVDFLWMGWGPLTTNIFNVADVAIMLGFALLIIDSVRNRKRAVEASHQP